MRISLGFGIAVLLVSINLAAAEEYKAPPMKDGLWQAHSVQTVAGKTESDTAIKICQSKELTQQSEATSAEVRKRDQCTSSITQRSADTVYVETRCAKGPNAGAVTRMVYSHTGDTASRMEMHSHRGSAESVAVIDMKYLGSCPTGMKPGEMIMPDGKKLGGN
jgi:hypothetical protein